MLYKSYIKRILDLIIGIATMPLLIAFVILVSLLIKMDDGGSIFYKAVRRGKDGKPFTMYKFRTMKEDAPDIRNEDNSTYSSANDFRVTRTGSFLRSTSIDELPQIINVLLGDMSLIGPRPNMATLDLKYLSEFEIKRLEIRPGITGYTQAYHRNSISKKERYIMDLYYIEKSSFLFDLKILLKTIDTVISRENINKEEIK